jgi:hypothetical protein
MWLFPCMHCHRNKRPSITHIYPSITQEIFPNKFKISTTVPIFKNGNSDLCDNYRLISLFSSLPKILEKHIAIQLINHLELNELLYEHQYGFRQHKSTEHELIHLTKYIYSALNYKSIVLVYFWTWKKLLMFARLPSFKKIWNHVTNSGVG